MQRLFEITDEKGITVSKLKPGTTLSVRTKNSTYDIVVRGGKEVDISGGSHSGLRFDSPKRAYFHGSTWGGSALKMDWIGEMMHMEFTFPGEKGVMVTTGVRDVSVTAPDGSWRYSLDWGTDSPK